MFFFSIVLPSHARDTLPLEFAKGFRVEKIAGCRLVTITPRWEGAGEVFRYLLVPRGMAAPSGHPGARIIEVPVRRIISLSTTHLAYIDAAGKTDLLVGLGGLNYVNTTSVRHRIETGKIREVGVFTNLQVETALDLSPDLILVSASGSVWDDHPKLLEAGLPTVPYIDHLESHPLARCEWIKLLAMFLGTEAHADTLFKGITHRYETLALKATASANRPRVIAGTPFQGQWHVALGDSFAARLIKDAGGDYLWSDTKGVGSRPMDVEAVYERALLADIWVNAGSWRKLSDAPATDSRFTSIPALAEGRVYNNNKRLNEWGGNDYWESGLLHPDIVLGDLVAIFHPEIVPDHKFVYYQRLE